MFCFFFKQKTAYEVRISDWSSDVCSSDLGGVEPLQRRQRIVQVLEDLGGDHSVGRRKAGQRPGARARQRLAGEAHATAQPGGEVEAQGRDVREEIGRASCRESVWPFG